MSHEKEHPLAQRRVCVNAMTGEVIRVIDWLDRLDGASYLLRPSNKVGAAFRERIEALGLHESGAVLAKSAVGFKLVHHAELPAYDPVPVGVIS